MSLKDPRRSENRAVGLWPNFIRRSGWIKLMIFCNLSGSQAFHVVQGLRELPVVEERRCLTP